jgi:uncharacterized delta-60 repeat protein
MRSIIVLIIVSLLIGASSVNRAQAAAGDLDTTFGSGGKLLVEFFGFTDTGKAIAIQRDGKYVIAAQVHSGSSFDFGVARYNNNGTPDLTFGNGGKVNTDFSAPPFSSVDDDPFDIVIQPDGKIIVVGSVNRTSVTGEDFGIARYNSDGSLDASFGTGGKVVTDFGGQPPFNNFDALEDIALQADGKIVAVGVGSMIESSGFGLARYNSDGSLDHSFGTEGKVVTRIGELSRATAVKVQADGKVVAGGDSTESTASSNSNYALARYNADGSLDGGFGEAGAVTTDFFGLPDFATHLTLQSGGKIILVGSTMTLQGFQQVSLARYDGGQVFDLCIQDNNSNNILRINSITGFYELTDCNGITIGGTATLRVRGCTITLQHNAPDRRVMVMVDICRGRGTATVQTFSPRRTINIADLDITDSCGCR